MAKKKNDEALYDNLVNWETLTVFLRRATEAECWQLLAHEREHLCRRTLMHRIHQTAGRLRQLRERMEIEDAAAECQKKRRQQNV